MPEPEQCTPSPDWQPRTHSLPAGTAQTEEQLNSIRRLSERHPRSTPSFPADENCFSARPYQLSKRFVVRADRDQGGNLWYPERATSPAERCRLLTRAGRTLSVVPLSAAIAYITLGPI